MSVAVYSSVVSVSRVIVNVSVLPAVMKTRKNLARIFAALLVVLMSAPVSAAGYLYRYKDANGRPVIARSIPPQFVDMGYEVLTERMRIVRVVPPADVREKMLAEQKAEKERLENDKRLLRTYNDVKEAEETRDRKVAEMELFIDAKKKGIDRLEVNLADSLRRAADMERQGKKVTPAILKNIDAIKTQISEEGLKLSSMRDELQELRGRFADDIERLRELLGDPEVPESPTGDGNVSATGE